MRSNLGFALRMNAICTGIVTLLVVACLSAPLSAQVLYSFENDLQGWTVDSTGTVTQSMVGATNGTHSMAVLPGATGYTADARVDADATAMDAIAATAGTGKLYDLKADVTFGPQSWTNISSSPGYFQVRLDSNSNGGFISNTLFQVPSGTQRTYKTATPLLDVFPTPDSLGFAQFRFGKNSNYGVSTPGQGVTYYVDNVRLQEIAENRIFSWEDTTPGVDNFEGWKNGFDGSTPSVRKIIRSTDADAYGITHGNSAMQILAPTAGFSWGTQFTLDGTAPEATRKALADGINAATAVRFDVTVPVDLSFVTGALPPSYCNLYLNIGDNSTHFYQSFDKSINIAGGSKTTVTIPLDELIDVNDHTTNLATAKIQGPTPGATPTFLRFALATGSDQPVAFAIDNFRLIHDVLPGIVGDYNNNGIVDAADYTVWRDHLGQSSSLPNRDPLNGTGAISMADYNSWKGAYGNHSGAGALAGGAAVPEPATLISGLLGAFGMSIFGMRRWTRR
jgi:hypothetical protein